MPWLSPTIFALIGASILLTVVFGWWLKRAPEPFLPLHVLANPVMRSAPRRPRFAMAVMTGFMIFMPLYFEMVHKLTPTQAGLALIPVIVMTTPGSMPSGRAMMHSTTTSSRAYVGMALATLAVAVAGLVAGHAGDLGGGRNRARRHRHRHRVSDHHGVRAERGAGGTRSASRPAR